MEDEQDLYIEKYKVKGISIGTNSVPKMFIIIEDQTWRAYLPLFHDGGKVFVDGEEIQPLHFLDWIMRSKNVVAEVVRDNRRYGHVVEAKFTGESI